MNWVTADLVEKGWLYRAFEVSTSEGTFRVAYDGRGIGYESVLVDGEVVAKQRSMLSFVPEFSFLVGTRQARVRVSVWPWSAIRAFSLEVDRQEVYTEE